MKAALSALFFLITIESYAQLTHRIEFDGFPETTGTTGKMATLYAGTLPDGDWEILSLIQAGEQQTLGGVSDNRHIIDNTLTIEAGGESFGLNHFQSIGSNHGGNPYQGEALSGFVEICLWELQTGTPTEAAPGSIVLIRANATIRIDFDGFSMGNAQAGHVATLFTGNLPEGTWQIAVLIQAGYSQPLGGISSDPNIVDNAIALETSEDAFGLLHLGSVMTDYGGSAYSGETLSGFVEVSLWETISGTPATVSPGTIVFRPAQSALYSSWPHSVSIIDLLLLE